MMKKVVLLIFIAFSFCGNAITQNPIDIKADNNIKNWFPQDTSIKLAGVSDGTYGYSFCYPQSFTYSVGVNKKNVITGDTSIMTSPKRNAFIRVWTAAETISCPQPAINFRIPYNDTFGYQSIVDTNEINRIDSIFANTFNKTLRLEPLELKDCSIKRHYFNKKNLSFAIHATRKKETFIYACILLEIAVSGNKAYSFISFRYPTALSKKFEPIAHELLDCFLGD